MSHAEADPLPPEAFEKILLGRGALFPIAAPLPIPRLARYLSELDRWRRSANLVGDLSPQELSDHALESALGSNLIAHGEEVVDVGSGAGFPGLPIAILRPDLKVALVEPRQKRAAFLRHAARDLGLSNVAVVEARIEEVVGQTFDCATTRAVGNLPHWLRKPVFLKPSGRVIAWLTASAGLEEALSARFRADQSLAIPGSSRRRIVVFRRK